MDYTKVIDYFLEIAQIPRCSWNEEWIRNYLIKFAQSRKLDYKVDWYWNLVIYVPSTFSKTESEIVVLQSHMDMVCVKDSECNINFVTDWLEIYEQDWFIMAKWTTLGADNWIWIAMMLASVDLPNHPRMELLFTVDEERGLNWALNLDWSMLSWNKVINLDSEDEWDICISSAWWCRMDLSRKFDKIDWKFPQYEILIWWMKWWHSWVEIDKNRWNAIYMFMQFLHSIKDEIEIVTISWGVADNVIPSSVNAILWIENLDNFTSRIDKFLTEYRSQYDCPELFYKVENSDEKMQIICEQDSLLQTIIDIKVWIYSMSEKIDWLVASSLNLWVLKLVDWNCSICYMARSSVMNELDAIIDNIMKTYKPCDFDIIMWAKYPWWEQDPECDLVKFVLSQTKEIFQEKAKLVAYHAWLECWVVAQKIWNVAQVVSIGPNIKWAHSVDEKLEIRSLAKVYELLKNILSDF